MKVYRICKQIYAHDLNGTGAEKVGGRWNSKGNTMLYTSESRALAMAEVAVHLPFAIIPKHFVVVVIEIPDEITAQEINLINLDKNWDVLPFEKNTQKIGDQFLAEKKHLTLKVPSVVVKGDFNYLINPSHKHFNKVKVIATEPFDFDKRILK